MGTSLFKIRYRIFLFLLVVSGLSAKAQAVTSLYTDEDGNACTATMTAYGLYVKYGEQTFNLPPCGMNTQGMVYSNGSIGATIDIMGQNLVLFDTNIAINFTFQKILSSAPGSGYPFGGGLDKNGSIVGEKTCSYCKGKGWVGGFKTPTYGQGRSYYCSECGKEVSASHSHDRCPSCMGKGTVPTIR